MPAEAGDIGIERGGYHGYYRYVEKWKSMMPVSMRTVSDTDTVIWTVGPRVETRSKEAR